MHILYYYVNWCVMCVYICVSRSAAMAEAFLCIGEDWEADVYRTTGERGDRGGER